MVLSTKSTKRSSKNYILLHLESVMHEPLISFLTVYCFRMQSKLQQQFVQNINNIYMLDLWNTHAYKWKNYIYCPRSELLQ
jgi:hypothetical protein